MMNSKSSLKRKLFVLIVDCFLKCKCVCVRVRVRVRVLVRVCVNYMGCVLNTNYMEYVPM